MASRRKLIRAQPSPSGVGFFVWFRHPHQAGRPLKASCQTTDQNQGNVIAADLTTFVNAPEQYPLTDEALEACASGFHARAIEIWFGRSAPDRHATAWEIRKADLIRAIPEARAEFARLALLDQENPLLRARVEELELELGRLRRQSGTHARVPLRQAVEAWAKEYPTGHRRRTVQQATTCARAFLAWAESRLGKRVFVGQIRRGDVAKWLSEVRSCKPSKTLQDDTTVTPPVGAGAGRPSAQDGTPPTRAREQPTPTVLDIETKSKNAELSPVTRKNFRAYLSTFFSWARDRYDLVENPASKIPVPGSERSAENIQAIRRYENLIEIANALRDWPYWRALWLVGVLMGPRWDELRHMRISHVFLQSRSLSIWAPKTHRMRQAPIERTLLLPALRSHLERRARERQGQDVDLPLFGGPGDGAQPEAIKAAALSDLLFPSYVSEGTKPRTKTEAGIWSHNVTFLRSYRTAMKAAWRQHSNAADWSKAPPAWRYGPREWRHSAGSAMGHCGCSSLEISQWIGNSEAVARRHYIPPVSGERWPLDYHGLKK